MHTYARGARAPTFVRWSMFKASRWGVLLTGAFAAGCGSIFDSVKNCTTQFVYGLQVDVLDSLITAPAGKGAVVVARDRGYADTARSALPSGSPGEEEKSFVLAGERRGTYEVTVERERGISCGGNPGCA